MTKVNLRLKIGSSNALEGPFALVGTSAELRKLASAIKSTTDHEHALDATFEVWIGEVQYGPDYVAKELERLLKKVRGEEPKP